MDDFIHSRHIRYNNHKEEWYCYYNIQWRYNYLIKEILEPIRESTEIDKYIEEYNPVKNSDFVITNNDKDYVCLI